MTATLLGRDRFQDPIQALELGTVQNISFTTAGSTATTNPFGGNTILIRVVATADCYVATGLTASVTATTSSTYLPAFAVEYFRVEEGGIWKVAARGVSASGTLNVTEMT